MHGWGNANEIFSLPSSVVVSNPAVSTLASNNYVAYIGVSDLNYLKPRQIIPVYKVHGPLTSSELLVKVGHPLPAKPQAAPGLPVPPLAVSGAGWRSFAAWRAALGPLARTAAVGFVQARRGVGPRLNAKPALQFASQPMNQARAGDRMSRDLLGQCEKEQPALGLVDRRRGRHDCLVFVIGQRQRRRVRHGGRPWAERRRTIRPNAAKAPAPCSAASRPVSSRIFTNPSVSPRGRASRGQPSPDARPRRALGAGGRVQNLRSAASPSADLL